MFTRQVNLIQTQMHYPEIQFLIMRSHYQPLKQNQVEPITIRRISMTKSSEEESKESDDDKTTSDNDNDHEIAKESINKA